MRRIIDVTYPVHPNEPIDVTSVRTERSDSGDDGDDVIGRKKEMSTAEGNQLSTGEVKAKESMTSSMSKVTAGKDSTVEEIQEKLRSSRVLRLELNECSFAMDDDRFTDDVIRLLSPDMTHLSVTSCSLSSRSIASLTLTCAHLQSLRFVNCPSLCSEALRAIADNCQHLKQLCFVFDLPTPWTLSPDTLSPLIRGYSALLQSVAFVGFDGLSDVEVDFFCGCYASSLRRINLNRCPSLTDSSLRSLANRCRALRDVSFSGTKVTDAGVKAIASASPHLQRLDLGDCEGVGDASVAAVADRCRRLERVSVENCRLVTDIALDALLTNCPSLQSMNFSGTSIRCVSPKILVPLKLKHFSAENCSQLKRPPPGGATRSISNIREFYKEYDAPFRIRVNFLGDRMTGKTSAIQRLVNGLLPVTSSPAPTELPVSTIWKPFGSSDTETADDSSPASSSSSSSSARERRRLVVELVDHPGRTVKFTEEGKITERRREKEARTTDDRIRKRSSL